MARTLERLLSWTPSSTSETEDGRKGSATVPEPAPSVPTASPEVARGREWEAEARKKEEEERKQREWPDGGVCNLLKPAWEAEACSPQQPQEKRARLCYAAAPPAAGGSAPTARKSAPPQVPTPIAAGLEIASAKTPGVLLAATCQHPRIHFSLLAS